MHGAQMTKVYRWALTSLSDVRIQPKSHPAETLGSGDPSLTRQERLQHASARS